MWVHSIIDSITPGGESQDVPFNWGLLEGWLVAFGPDALQIRKAQFLTKSVWRAEAEQFVPLNSYAKSTQLKVFPPLIPYVAVLATILKRAEGRISESNLLLSNPTSYHTLLWTVSVALCPHKITLHAVATVRTVSFLLWACMLSTYSSHMKKLKCLLGASCSLVLILFLGPQL